MTTPAEELRTAADKLRTLAGDATPGPWRQSGIGDYGWSVDTPDVFIAETEDSEKGRADADHIAAMHPAVGLALADWLDETARNAEPFGTISHHAVNVARAINGGQP
ncbi:hypothetical protein [Streptomyces sp. NPDC001492]